ncbi:hypothetical protein llap_2052 [Limosa lapponica baueri]|uniref:Uncharacterized protein n=1 Tax=Limosa lapponica baueri TaxID=1758121 RepID=A0A2I0UNN8_LIMLA|nr:hypothetical protein llap_2052 [Limosa lapponica baueri]
MRFWCGVLSTGTELDSPSLTAELGLARETTGLPQVYLFWDMVKFAYCVFLGLEWSFGIFGPVLLISPLEPNAPKPELSPPGDTLYLLYVP